MTGARPILTVAQSRAADAAAIAAGTPLTELMARAGRAVADAVRARWTPRPVLVLCGPGDKGGDGFVAADALRQAGWPVRVASLPPSGKASPAAEAARAAWGEPLLPLHGDIGEASLVIDALFGAGLARALPAEAVAALRAAARAGAEIVAADLPSGVAADTGRAGEGAPACVLTVSFQLRPAHLLQPSRALCGEVRIAEIGAPPVGEVRLWENAPSLWAKRVPWPDVSAHKMQRGRLVVVGGSASHTGAARLSARAGLRAGAGLVTVLSPPDALRVYAAALEAVMVRAFEGEAELRRLAEDADAAVVGPGAGVNAATAEHVRTLAQTGAALVVDADALTAFRDDPDALFATLDRDDVLTPHPGEFDRVFPGLLKEAPERITAARRAAERAGCVVLLKGPDTVIAAPDGRAAVNANAAPWLATAGSGDVLAGVIAGLIAQGMDSWEAACAGAWVHAEAGARFGPGLTADDLPAALPAVLRRLYEGRP